METTTENDRIVEGVRHELDDGLLRITLDRPQVGNALTLEMRSELVRLHRWARTDHAVRAVLLRAEGRHFCTGTDLKVAADDMLPDNGAGSHRVGEIADRLNGVAETFTTIFDCPKPVVVAVNGTAAGIGVPLALVADIAVLSSTASYLFPFMARGLMPDGLATYLLPRSVGLLRAKRMLLLGERISADEALTLGLATEVVAPDDLDTTAEALARRLAAGPTYALGVTKRMLNRSLDTDLTATGFLEGMVQETVLMTEDASEGVRSFVEKRPTRFQGF